MVQCPHCEHQFEADFGMVSCPSCRNILIVDIDGNAQIGELAETVMEGDSPQSEAVMGGALVETMMESPALAETLMEQNMESLNREIPEESFANYQMDETLMAPPQQRPAAVQSPAQIQSEEQGEPENQAIDDWWENDQADSHLEAGGEYQVPEESPYEEFEEIIAEEIEEAEEAEEIDKAGEVAEVMSPELEEEEEEWLEKPRAAPANADLSEIAAYGNSEVSLAKDGLYFYDLRISGIDSSKEKREVADVLEDARFAWNAKKMLASMENGVLVIEKVTAIKASVLVNRLKGLNLKVQWKQNVLTQMDVN